MKALALAATMTICLGTGNVFAADETPGESVNCPAGTQKFYVAFQRMTSEIRKGVFTDDQVTETGFGSIYLCGPAGSYRTTKGLKEMIGAIKNIIKTTPIIMNVIELDVPTK
jgi:hypothetical protein